MTAVGTMTRVAPAERAKKNYNERKNKTILYKALLYVSAYTSTTEGSKVTGAALNTLSSGPTPSLIERSSMLGTMQQ